MRKPYEIAGGILIALLSVAPAAPAASLKIVAIQNNSSPVVNTVYKKFDNPVISDAAGERVAVLASIGRKCIFSIDPDNDPDSTVACQRDPSPDLRQFRTFAQPTINSSSNVAWAAKVSSGRQGVYRSGPTVVSTTGDPAPAPATGLLDDFAYGSIADSGDVTYEATISGGAVVLGVEIDQGIFRCSGGNGNCSGAFGGTGTLTADVLVNDAVPDRVGRELCHFFGLSASSFGAVFVASTQLDCADGSETPLVGVFRKPVAGAVTTVALQGEPSQPFTSPGGTTYRTFTGLPAISNNGFTSFLGTTTGLLTSSILWVCNPATCPLAPAIAGVQQGDLDDDSNAFRSFSPPGVSDAGDIAFSSKSQPSTGGTRDGVYIRRSTSDIETVALSNTNVPGAMPAAIFFRVLSPSMSSGGKVAFAGRLKRVVTPRQLRAVFVFE